MGLRGPGTVTRVKRRWQAPRRAPGRLPGDARSGTERGAVPGAGAPSRGHHRTSVRARGGSGGRGGFQAPQAEARRAYEDHGEDCGPQHAAARGPCGGSRPLSCRSPPGLSVHLCPRLELTLPGGVLITDYSPLSGV